MARGRAEPDAFAAALALLTGRALTSGELAARLRRRGFAEEAAAAAVERAAGCGLVDDRRTAAAWAAGAARLRGLGPGRVRDGLAKRHLSREIVEEVTAAAFGAGEEERLAAAALERWERTRGPAAARRPAAYAHLLRRGFSAAAARSALFRSPEME